MSEQDCKQCQEYRDHIADLRNKFGRIYCYGQLLDKLIENGGYLEAGLSAILVEHEDTIIKDIEHFAKLLKKEI